ncbi:MAG TPA: hypothetical protein VGN51_10145 [Acidimicrobiia bacterium]|jgi:plasmid stabilization system protein ParE
MVVMIVAGIAIFIVGIALIWYLLARGSRAATLSEQDFDDAYDQLVLQGEASAEDRKAAWEDFHAEQVREERERLSWEQEEEGT